MTPRQIAKEIRIAYPGACGYALDAADALDQQATEIARLRTALGMLVRKGTDGRWYTSQHGDSDVTTLVSGAIEQDVSK